MKKSDFWVIVFLMSCLSLAALVVWFVSGIVFVFGNSDYTGAIVYVLHWWMFILSPFVFLYKARVVHKRVDSLIDHLHLVFFH